ncbi:MULTISPECIES: hypothetical protein [Cellvibrio]|uniref:Uncharacterized protein n=1 Tax=Cellvibrio fibrivorans TaxID=126350 RepID=A0ABU1V0A5_9GAMM|nr:hypothetical protein [Cellvibrio fibrivorans]MDR7090850.1 hypothetical protein [Cellvibrio fibrivorans]
MSNKPVPTESESPARLPCRGCQPGCSSYATCDGKPWRLEAQPKPVAH